MTNDNNKIIKIIDDITETYSDSDFMSLALQTDGFEENEVEIYSKPNYINEPEINYYEDDSEIYSLHEELINALEEYNVTTELSKADNEEDYHVLWIRWRD